MSTQQIPAVSQHRRSRGRRGDSRSPGSTGSTVGDPARFRPSPRHRVQILIGVCLAAVAIAGNLAMYSSLDERVEVLQAAREIPAGTMIGVDDLAVTRVAVDPAVPVISVDRIDTIVGRFARTRIASGALVVGSALQSTPVVSARSGIVAVRVPEGSLPEGLRERSRVQVVLPSADAVPIDPMPGDAPAAIAGHGVIPGIVVAAPEPVGVALIAVSIEVARSDAIEVARSNDVRLVLISPDLHRRSAP
jgi:hypothetical protein